MVNMRVSEIKRFSFIAGKDYFSVSLLIIQGPGGSVTRDRRSMALPKGDRMGVTLTVLSLSPRITDHRARDRQNTRPRGWESTKGTSRLDRALGRKAGHKAH